MADTQSVQYESGTTGPTPPEGQQPGTQTTDDGGQRPEWLPEKFNDPQEMANAYAELEAKLGRGQSAGSESGGDTDGNGDDDGGGDNGDGDETGYYYSEAIDATLSNAGVDPAAVQQEFADNQQLGEETYEKLEQAGYPREMVDAYVKGLQADAQSTADAYAAEVFNEVGGQQVYNQVTEWAAANLEQSEIDNFNAAVEAGPEAAKWAVRGLVSQYRESEGTEPSRSLSGRTSTNPSDAFTSTQQVVEAMADSRYKNDPAYRQQIQNKIQRSNVF